MLPPFGMPFNAIIDLSCAMVNDQRKSCNEWASMRAHSRSDVVILAATGPALALRAARLGFEAINALDAAATFAFGIAKLDAEAFGWVVDAAAEDDEAAANWGADDGCDAKISSTTATLATFFALLEVFKPAIAKAEQQRDKRQDKNPGPLGHERLEPKVGYGKKKKLKAAAGVGGTPSNGRTNERTTRTAKDEHTTGKHPAPTHRTGHQAHSPMIHACMQHEEV